MPEETTSPDRPGSRRVRDLTQRVDLLEQRSAALERSVRGLRVIIFLMCWLTVLVAAGALYRQLRAL